MRRATSTKDALRFFLPLIFMTELNMISKAVINAFMARLPNPKTGLAGLNVAFFFYFTLTSPTETASLLSISYLRDRRSFRHLYGFFCLMLALPLSLALVIAITPFGTWLYGALFGGSPEVIRQAQQATLILTLSAPALMLRALAFGMIMLKRRTALITLSTFLRLASLGVSLLILPRWLQGASVGAAALVICMAVEGAFAFAVAIPYFRALPPGEGPKPSYLEMWRFSWPVVLNQATESGVAVVINIFLGRLANPDLALASFGVVHSLASLILSPIRNLVQTAQTLVRTSHDLRVLFRFTNYLVVIFALLVMGLFFSPARVWVLKGVMGLTDEMSGYSEPAVMITFVVIVFWGYAALFRGLLAGERKTYTFAVSAAGRVLTVVGLGGVTLMWDDPNGAVFGVLAWGAAFMAETLILGWRLFFPLPGAEPVYNVYRARARRENLQG